ncbi:MAG: hypothetical protein V1824_01335 [archaeon]
MKIIKLNQRGGLLDILGGGMIPKILLVLLLVMLSLPLMMMSFPIVKYVVAVIIGFFIYELVVGSLGEGVLSYLITGVLLYFIVFKYLLFSASLMMIYVLLTVGGTSVIIWGLARFSKK